MPSEGRRLFDFKTAPGGHVSVEAAPALLRRVHPTDYDAREDGGQAIPMYRMPPDARAFRWVASHDDRHAFVIGTKADADQLQARLCEVTQYKGSKMIRVDNKRFDAVFRQLVAEREAIRR